MCEPTTLAIASLAVSAIGTGAGIYMQQQQADDMRSAQNEQQQRAAAARISENQRQDEINRRSRAMWEGNLQNSGADAFEDSAGRMESRVADTLASISPAASETGLLAGQEDASPVMRGVVAGEIARGSREARERTAALARLSGYGAATQEQATKNNLFDAEMGLQRSLSRGSLGVYAAEANMPANYQGGDNTMAAIMSGVGGLAAQYAGRNWNVGSTGAATKSAADLAAKPPPMQMK